MSKLFQNLEIEAFRAGVTPRTDQSREWFRQRARSIRRVNREQLMKSNEVIQGSKSVIGNMYMFFYDPKHKDTLPYYDQFPLVFIVGDAKGGFTGLNLHYLPPTLRAKLLGSLIDLKSNNKYNASTKLRLSYDVLNNSSKHSLFKPCFKQYLTSQVRSQFSMVPAAEWEIATFLPMAQWKKSSSTQVYRDSRKMV